MAIFLISTSSFVFGVEMSYTVVDLDSGKIVKSQDAERPMILASVSKIYTAYYTLNRMDSNKTIPTKVSRSKNSKIKDGILEGDLIISGEGNPFLTAQNLLDLIYQVKANDIKAIKGKFIIDGGDFWFTERLSSLGLEDQADNPSMGSLNVEFNRFEIDKKTNLPIPLLNYIKIQKGDLKSPGLKYQKIKNSLNQETWKKNTKEYHKKSEEIPTRNSLLFFGHFFQYLAGLNGLKLPPPEIEKVEKEKMEVLAIQESLPIYRLVELGLEYSNNLIAEMLLQQIHSMSPIEATQKMLSWYREKFSEINWKKTQLENASGITLQNQTTSSNLAQLLTKIYQIKNLKRPFISYLSINGHSGGIQKRLKTPDLSFRVYAKTGSLFYVNNLAGYFTAKSGKMYAFSIFTTDTKKRNTLNKPNSKKVNQVRQAAKAWYSTSTVQIDSLLKNLIKTL